MHLCKSSCTQWQWHWLSFVSIIGVSALSGRALLWWTNTTKYSHTRHPTYNCNHCTVASFLQFLLLQRVRYHENSSSVDAKWLRNTIQIKQLKVRAGPHKQLKTSKFFIFVFVIIGFKFNPKQHVLKPAFMIKDHASAINLTFSASQVIQIHQVYLSPHCRHLILIKVQCCGIFQGWGEDFDSLGSFSLFPQNLNIWEQGHLFTAVVVFCITFKNLESLFSEVA